MMDIGIILFVSGFAIVMISCYMESYSNRQKNLDVIKKQKREIEVGKTGF